MGRKPALLLSIWLIAISTFLLGLLPTFQTIGIWAPILLVLVRLLQGLSSGGEFTGSIIFVVEHVEQKRRNFFGSLGMLGISLGLLLASFIAWLINLTFNHQQVLDWAWRIPFWLALAGGLLGWFIRRSVTEPDLFKESKQLVDAQSYLSHKRELSKRLKQGMIILGITLFGVALTYLIYIFVVTYMSTILHYTTRQTLTINISSVILLVLLEPCMGKIADKVGRRPLMLFAIIGSIIWVFPYFILLQYHQLIWAFFAQSIMTVFASAYFAVATVAMIESVAIKKRFSIVSFFYALGASIFGGGTPFIATLLVKLTDSYLSLSIYLIFCAILSLWAVYKLREPSIKSSDDYWM